MMQQICRVTDNRHVGGDIHVLTFHSPEIARSVLPGQFVNLRVDDSYLPLLRRPFSVYHIHGDDVSLIFNIVGPGTHILSRKHAGDLLDVLGPLGSPFHIEGEYATAILVAGGLGVAPLPVITRALHVVQKQIVTFLGARTKEHLITTYLEDVSAATDDGSAGFHGTVVDLLVNFLREKPAASRKVFACGPTPMLASLFRVIEEFQIPCEVSLESSMACGIGICQGCPVERTAGGKRYALICKEGPVFSSTGVKLESW
ncbi:MAG TPA: dihydroorotate dehydrogenase electron transfer subunit [Bacteroidota bacterium]|nr:dihydroorotate dehydrogenase electron transfer subunit [Bacteroidota bacterium]